jgi:hypothetical protein
VRISCGGNVGAGFLIGGRHVMTCAHVVRAHKDERPEVLFVQHPDWPPVAATVVAGTGWDGGAQDRGDVAVLELDVSVDVAPARFASLEQVYAEDSGRLVAYGFPLGYDTGTLGEYRTTGAQRIADEWMHVECCTSHGQPLDEGFSGSALVRPSTGEVMGMVTATSNDPSVRVGRMLPVDVLARYWPGASDLVPVPGCGVGERRELRDLLERVSPGDRSPAALYREVVDALAPGPPPHPALTLWDVAWYLMTEVEPPPGRSYVAEFARHVADQADDTHEEGRHALRLWARRHSPRTEAVGTPETVHTPWSPILIEIERSGRDRDSALVGVYVFRDQTRLTVGTPPRTVPLKGLRAHVLDRIDAAFRELDRTREALIAFAVPRDWLDEPLDRWPSSEDDATPLGCSAPVVVMDLDRCRGGRLPFTLQKKWEVLDRLRSIAWHRVECGSRVDPDRFTVRLRSGEALLAFGSPPRTAHGRRLLDAGIRAPVPVMVWPRSGCGEGRSGCGVGHSGADGTACPGTAFLDAVHRELAGSGAADLPREILRLRNAAFLHEADEPHWADGIVLLWEDPRLFPEPFPAHRCPVH